MLDHITEIRLRTPCILCTFFDFSLPDALDRHTLHIGNGFFIQIQVNDFLLNALNIGHGDGDIFFLPKISAKYPEGTSKITNKIEATD